MGFFDKLRDITNAVAKVTNTARNVVDFADDPQEAIEREARRQTSRAVDKAVSGAVNKAVGSVNQPAVSPSAANNGAILPAKPSRLVEETFYDNDENENEIEIKYSFMLSGDFIRFDSGAAEIDYSAQYEPDSNDDYTEYDGNKPAFSVVNGAEDYIYDMIERFKSSGTVPDAYEFRSINQGKLYFKAKIKFHNKVLYMYALDRGNMWKNNYIGVEYNPNLMGTPLEQKLIAAVDETVSSYREEII